MRKNDGIGNIANRSLVDVSRKSPGFDPDSKLGNTAKRSLPQGRIDNTTKGGPEKIGFNKRGEIMPQGRLDNKTKTGPGCDA